MGKDDFDLRSTGRTSFPALTAATCASRAVFSFAFIVATVDASAKTNSGINHGRIVALQRAVDHER